ncbi:MAG TPA: DUF983 domain-containing protein [Candidatus Acidoferrales bacterium]|nr:DUF983 domain-containing protein [Candidatus Acidoferrales bacterium]
MENAEPGAMMDWSAILHGRCPRCRKGAIYRLPVWRGYLSMYERCPECGLKFEREPGYFLGAMYVSYLVSIPPVLALMLVFWRVLAWRFDLAVVGAFVAYLPLVPVVTRAARVVWMHVDRHFDPD